MANGSFHELSETERIKIEAKLCSFDPTLNDFAQEKNVEVRRTPVSRALYWSDGFERWILLGQRRGGGWILLALAEEQRDDGPFKKTVVLRQGIESEELERLGGELPQLLEEGWRLANGWSNKDLERAYSG